MRLHVTRKTDLAVRLLRALADAPAGPCTSAELALVVDSTRTYLPQVLAPLLRAGWVTSEAGPNGGYRLATDVAGLSLLDVVETVEGPLDDGRCVMSPSSCSDDAPCDLHGAWTTARRALRGQLEGMSLIAPLAPAGVASTIGSPDSGTSVSPGGSTT